ncbi:MAG: serine protease, partial [Planctomycetaceae bacterium]|nr:serine protease [Planctomycetaceae bacterium]
MFSLTATGRNTKPRGFWDDGDWGDFLDFWESDSGEENSGKTPEAPGAQPWMVALVDRSVSNAYDGQFCGGSLIDAQWVLTAAHCVEGESASSIDAVIGRYELSSNEGQRIHVAQIITHPNYDDYTTENDIALLQLAQPASVGQPIDIIDDAREQFDDPTIVAHVSGWGVIPEQNDNFPDELHGVDVPIATQANCSNVYDESIPGTMLCAGQ